MSQLIKCAKTKLYNLVDTDTSCIRYTDSRKEGMVSVPTLYRGSSIWWRRKYLSKSFSEFLGRSGISWDKPNGLGKMLVTIHVIYTVSIIVRPLKVLLVFCLSLV